MRWNKIIYSRIVHEILILVLDWMIDFIPVRWSWVGSVFSRGLSTSEHEWTWAIELTYAVASVHIGEWHRLTKSKGLNYSKLLVFLHCCMNTSRPVQVLKSDGFCSSLPYLAHGYRTQTWVLIRQRFASNVCTSVAARRVCSCCSGRRLRAIEIRFSKCSPLQSKRNH